MHTENKQQLDALYAKYVLSEHIRGSAEMRKKGDKNLDDAGVKEWLSKYKTKEGAPGTRSNAHELFYLDKEPLEEAIDFIVKHLSADFPQPKAVRYSRLFDLDYVPTQRSRKR